MKNHFNDVSKYLRQGKKIILARIIKQSGSVPRAAGTQCIILEDGSIKGTIGGGLLEHQVMERGRECLQNEKSSVMHFELTGEEVAQTDMICGGVADVYLEPVFPQNAVAGKIFNRIDHLINHGGNGVLLTLISDGIGPEDAKSRVLIEEDESATGEIGIIPAEDKKRLTKYLEIKSPALTKIGKGKQSIFVEPVRPYDTLYLFGAGHVSTFVASLA
ncbi:MAG: XdhC family protein, partial [Desulfobacterales bacterium]|nr:XdhC family protein [Desulfobacterales bacterium]